MSETQKQTPDELFTEKLQAQQTESYESMGEGFKDGIDAYITHSLARGGFYLEHFKKLFAEKSLEISVEFEQMQREQTDEVKEVATEWLLEKHKVVLNSLVQRFMMVMELQGAADKMVSTDREFNDLIQHGYKMLEEIDIKRLMKEQMSPNKNPLKVAFGAQRFDELSLDPDYILIVSKVANHQELTDDERNIMLGEFIKLSADGKFDQAAKKGVKLAGGVASMQEKMAVLMFSYMDQPQRAEFAQRILDEKNKVPNPAYVLTTLVATNYLRLDVAVFLINEEVERLEARGKDPNVKKDELAKINERLKEFNKSQKLLGGEGIQNIMEFLREKEEKMVKELHREVGSKNRAASALSAKGIIGNILMVEGAFTVVMNILVDYKHPWRWPTNPALGIGLAALGGGAHITRGMDGILPTPLGLLGKLQQNKDELKDEEFEKVKAEITNSFFNSEERFKRAEFYFNYTDEIVHAYRDKIRNKGSVKADLTLEDLGITSLEQIPEEIRPKDMEEAKKMMENVSTWVQLLSQTNGGLGILLPEDQRNYLQAARTGYKPPKGTEKAKPVPPFKKYTRPKK